MLRLGLESVFSHCLCQITTGAHRLHLCPHALSSLRLLWIHCLCSCQVNFFTCVLDLIPFPYSSATIFFLFYCNLIMCSNLALFFLPLHTTKELLDSPSAFWLLPHSSLLWLENKKSQKDLCTVSRFFLISLRLLTSLHHQNYSYCAY